MGRASPRSTPTTGAHLAVHVGGSFNTARAAWPHMVEQGYGRIVMTTSAGMFGLPENTSYATAKGGVVGMTRSLAPRGAKHGIKVNAHRPGGRTRMAGGRSGDIEAQMAPDLVAPMAAFLAHEDCPVTRRDLRRRRGAVRRASSSPRPPGYCTPAADAASRTSPRTGTRSTTRPGTRSRPTSSLVGGLHVSFIEFTGASCPAGNLTHRFRPSPVVFILQWICRGVDAVSTAPTPERQNP